LPIEPFAYFAQMLFVQMLLRTNVVSRKCHSTDKSFFPFEGHQSSLDASNWSRDPLESSTLTRGTMSPLHQVSF